MQVSVVSAALESVVLSAPLEPNLNHKHTAFGGSVSALGILAAWSIVHIRLVAAGHEAEVVIQSNHMDYAKPIQGDFTAASALADPAAWPAFEKMLTHKGVARIEARSALSYEGAIVGHMTGRFVALRAGRRS